MYIYIYVMPQLFERSSHLFERHIYIYMMPHIFMHRSPSKRYNYSTFGQYLPFNMMGRVFSAAHRISTKLLAPERANELESVPHEDLQISSPWVYTCVMCEIHWITMALWSVERNLLKIWQVLCQLKNKGDTPTSTLQAWLYIIDHHGAFVRDVLPKSWCHA